MTNLRLKLRIIFIPFILVFLLVVLLFCLVKWYIEVTHRIELLDEWNYDGILCSLVTLLLLRLTMYRRIKILYRDTASFFNNISFFNVVSFFAVVVPANYALNYVSNAYSSVVYVTSMADIQNKQQSRYYIVKNALPDTANKLVRFSSYTSGKRHHVRTFTCQAVYPMCTLQDSVAVEDVWYCRYFEQSIDNSNNDEVIKVAEDRFKGDCYSILNKLPIDASRTIDYENLPDNHLRANFADIIPLGKYDVEDIVMLMPMSDSRITRSTKDLWYCFMSLGIGMSIVLALLIWMPVDKTSLESYLQGKIPVMDDKNGFWLLYPYRYHPLALLFYIASLCVIAWIVIQLV